MPAPIRVKDLARMIIVPGETAVVEIQNRGEQDEIHN